MCKTVTLIAKTVRVAMRLLHELKRLQVSAHLVDARGCACPLPIIELAKALKSHSEVELWADDPAAKGDLQAFLLATSHRLTQMGDSSAPLLQAVIRAAQ